MSAVDGKTAEVGVPERTIADEVQRANTSHMEMQWVTSNVIELSHTVGLNATVASKSNSFNLSSISCKVNRVYRNSRKLDTSLLRNLRRPSTSFFVLANLLRLGTPVLHNGGI